MQIFLPIRKCQLAYFIGKRYSINMLKKPNTNIAVQVIARELQAAKSRVTKLEQRNRFLIAAISLCGISVISVIAFLVAFMLSSQKSITARQFIVTGDDGEYRVILGSSSITILDNTQNPRAHFGVGIEGYPLLKFFDDQGRMRSTYGLKDTGIPHLSLFDEHEKRRGLIGLDQEGLMKIDLFNEAGQEVESYGLYPQSWVKSLENQASSDSIIPASP